MMLKTVAAAAFATQVALTTIPVQFEFSQPVTCENIVAWEILSAPITTRKPEPTLAQAQSDGVITNEESINCTERMISNVVISAFGHRRYWLKAIHIDEELSSIASNPIDADIPLVVYWPKKCNRLVVARHDEADRVPRVQWQPKDCYE